MNQQNRLMRIFSTLEWQWSLLTLIKGSWAVGSFALPAWAASAAGMFSQYAPLSWVASGFLGLLAYALAIFLIGSGRSRLVRSKYDAKFMLETGGVDPLAKVFEGKRIYLNDFILPSNPFINGKNFVDCEIVGPANIFLQQGNNFADVPNVKIDAVALVAGALFYNGYTFSNCNFRGCTFHRVTFFWSNWEAPQLAGSPFLNWISSMPTQMSLPGTDPAPAIQDQAPQPPKENEEGTPN